MGLIPTSNFIILILWLRFFCSMTWRMVLFRPSFERNNFNWLYRCAYCLFWLILDHDGQRCLARNILLSDMRMNQSILKMANMSSRYSCNLAADTVVSWWQMIRLTYPNTYIQTVSIMFYTFYFFKFCISCNHIRKIMMKTWSSFIVRCMFSNTFSLMVWFTYIYNSDDKCNPGITSASLPVHCQQSKLIQIYEQFLFPLHLRCIKKEEQIW